MLTALVDDDAVLGEALSNATGIGRVRCEIRGDGSREVDGLSAFVGKDAPVRGLSRRWGQSVLIDFSKLLE